MLLRFHVQSLVSRIANQLGLEIHYAHKLSKANLQSLFRLIKRSGLHINSVFDIGANRAGWSREAAKYFPSASYTLVEPLDEMEPSIKPFLDQHANSTWIRGCCGSINEQRQFVVMPNLVSSSLYIPVEHVDQEQVRNVETYTLDQLAATRGIPDMIKIDAEGAELEILQGGPSVIGQTELILLELPFFSVQPNVPLFSEMVQYMSVRGYEPYHFTWFGPRPHDGATALCELAFARNGGFLRRYQGW